MIVKTKPLFQCFDQADIEIVNNYQSTYSKFLNIQFKIPEDLCVDKEKNIECIPDRSYSDNAADKWIILLQN